MIRFANKYRPDIDGLRAAAVLSVIGFHAFPAIFKGGFVGVDIFFVISGYLISRIIFNKIDTRTFSFLDFYSRRIRRIFPALIIVLVACCIFGYFALFDDEYMRLGKHIAAGVSFVINFVLWKESGYFDSVAEIKPLLHLWSLSIEEQFYIIYPGLLYLCSKLRIFSIKLIVFIFVFSFSLNIIRMNVSIREIFYAPYTRFWELMLGGILAYASLYGWRSIFTTCLNVKSMFGLSAFNNSIFRGLCSVAGFTLIAISVVLLNQHKNFPGWYALLPTLGTCFIISAGPKAWFNRYLLSNLVVVWFGLISYPLYLWHWPLLSFAHIVESNTPSLVIRCAAILFSVILAWLTYEFIEKPIRFGKKHAVLKTIVLCFAMIIIGFAGYYIYKHKGLETRHINKYFHDNSKELLRTANRDEKCLSYIKNNDPSFYYCRYSYVGGSKTAALIGDSHAHTAFLGLSELLAKNKINLVLLANSSCPPFLGSNTGGNKKERQQCTVNISNILKIITNKQEIKTVFIATRGQVYIDGKELIDTKIKEANLLRSDKNPMINSFDVFRDSLQKTIDFLVTNGKKVFYIVDNPEIGMDPKICIYRPFRITMVRDCKIKLNIINSVWRDYFSILPLLKAVTIINMVDKFCLDGICQVIVDNKLLYADADHLSMEGSRFLAKAINDFLFSDKNVGPIYMSQF